MNKCHKGKKNPDFKVFLDAKKIMLNIYFFNQNVITLMELKVRKNPRSPSRNRFQKES